MYETTRRVYTFAYTFVSLSRGIKNYLRESVYILQVVGIEYSTQGVTRKYTEKRILSIQMETKFAKTVYFRRPSINGKRKYTVYTLRYDSYIRTERSKQVQYK